MPDNPTIPFRTSPDWEAKLKAMPIQNGATVVHFATENKIPHEIYCLMQAVSDYAFERGIKAGIKAGINITQTK